MTDELPPCLAQHVATCQDCQPPRADYPLWCFCGEALEILIKEQNSEGYF